MAVVHKNGHIKVLKLLVDLVGVKIMAGVGKILTHSDDPDLAL